MVVGDGEHSRWTVLMTWRCVASRRRFIKDLVERGEYSDTDSVLRQRSVNLKSPRPGTSGSSGSPLPPYTKQVEVKQAYLDTCVFSELACL